MIDSAVKYGENTPSSEFSSALLQKTHLPPQTFPLKGEGFINAYTTILKIELFLHIETRHTCLAQVWRVFLSPQPRKPIVHLGAALCQAHFPGSLKLLRVR